MSSSSCCARFACTECCTPAQKMNPVEVLRKQYTAYEFRVHDTGYVERKFGKCWRRVCEHNRRPQECGTCMHDYAKDKTIEKRGAPPPLAPNPEDFDPFKGRDHAIAPVISANFSDELVKGELQMLERGGTRQENGCIVYNGEFEDGMGVVSFQGKVYRASILAWMFANNRIVPEGFEIRHKCKTEGCYESTHLEIGTKRQNMFEDKLRDGTLPHGEVHHFSTITNELALKIFKSKGEGTRAERAIRFKISSYIVKKIDSGASWSHVTGKHKGSITTRERLQKKRKLIQRSDATKKEYEDAIERIDAHSVKKDNGCIETTYHRDLKGYGSFGMKGHSVKVHIVVWEYYKNNCKVVPEGMVVRHTCDNPSCCNKDHLIIGTQGDNIQDQWDRGRRAKRIKKVAKNDEKEEDDKEMEEDYEEDGYEDADDEN